jgi:P4 family phage/plasmid primase-like protien
VGNENPIAVLEPEPTGLAEWSSWAVNKTLNSPWLKELEPWQQHADDLARWTMQRLVVRDDVYGGYYLNKDGTLRRFKKVGPVTPELISDHFGLTNLESIIGLYTTSLDDKCKGLTIDLDRHDGDPDDLVQKNWSLASDQYAWLVAQGFHPLLIDSNGKGGLHLRLLFSDLVPAAQVRAFGLWLVRESEKIGLSKMPEVFPKQDTIAGKFGNFIRLFGRHHHRQFLSRVWDGKQWLEGEDAIEVILNTTGDPASLIPQETIIYQPAKRPRTTSAARECSLPVADDGWWKKYQGDLRTLDILGLLESKGLAVLQINDRDFEVECPWAAEHTTGDDAAGLMLADEDEEAFPVFHCFHDHCKDRSLKDVLALFSVEEVDQHCAKKFGKQGSDDDRPVIVPNDPLATARIFQKNRFAVGDDRTLVHHHGQWHLWDGRKYEEASEDDIRAKTWKWLATCSYWSKPSKTGDKKLLDFTPSRSTVTATMDALKAVVNLPSRLDMPCWIGQNPPCQPENIVAFDNGLLDLEQFVQHGETKLLPHSPRWFSANCLPHEFDPNAECPLWLSFLNQVFEHDQERIRALAQWFGYNLTLDNRQQKFVLFVGPPRSGKGTTMTVLTHLLGKQNVANPTLTSLGTRFGLAPLIGKQAAVVPDAHLGRNADAFAILERLKSIVGCDDQNVDRKNKSELANVRITARFTIAVNELPRLPDASVSLRWKVIAIPYNVSFVGKEDIGLSEKLLAEIPGITNWALKGLTDLRQTGKLLQPKAGEAMLADFVRLSSPMTAFIEDCCEVGPDKSQTTSEVFKAWQLWCQDNGHEVGSTTAFGTRLKAALVGVDKARVRDGGSLVYYYRGLRLTDDVTKRVNSSLHVLGT